jgi:hypothetical protein
MWTTILITMGATLLASDAFLKVAVIDDVNQMLRQTNYSYSYDAVTALAIPGVILLVIGLISLSYKMGKKSK